MDEYQLIEIDEAIEVGERVLDCIDEVMGYLDSAKRWGFIDIFSKASIISSIIKHSKLDKAQSAYEDLRFELERFNDELDDIQIYDTGEDIAMGGTMKFFDWFADNMFVDFFTISRISQSQQHMEDLEDQVNDVLDRLRSMKEYYED